MKRWFINLSLLAFALTMSGCATEPTLLPAMNSASDVYNSIYNDGQRSTVQLLREGMRSDHRLGFVDPGNPIRSMDEVIPVWVYDRVDSSTGRKVQGHWQHSVIKQSDWAQ